jgi:hypothetical protein
MYQKIMLSVSTRPKMICLQNMFPVSKISPKDPDKVPLRLCALPEPVQHQLAAMLALAELHQLA